MIKINRAVEYALISLGYIVNSSSSIVKTKEITKKHKCPFDATARSMQVLTKAGILESVQGVNGGFRFKKSLNQVTFYDLLVIILGPLGVTNCMTSDNIALNHLPNLKKHKYTCNSKDQCNLINPLKIFQQKLIQFYQGITLDDFFKATTLDTKPVINPDDTKINITKTQVILKDRLI